MARLSSIPDYLARALAEARADGRILDDKTVAGLSGAGVVRGSGPPPPPEGCSEAVFQQHIRTLALWGGWKFYHTLRSKGSDPDFPDVIAACQGSQGVAAELKVKKNKPTKGQLEWLELLRQIGFRTFVWYPRDWPEIEQTLGHR